MAEMDFNQVLEWLKEEMEKLNEHKTENIPSFNIPEPFLSVIERQRKEIEKQHFEILALESNLKGNDKIIKKQQMEIDSLTLDKGYLLEENKYLKEHRDNLNSIIFDLEKEIAKWKEKEFAACSKHHEFIDEIERLEKEIENLKQYKKVLMENSIVRSKTIERYEKALNEICRYVNYVGEPIEVYNIANKALKGE